jgi:molybdopterin converting factor small subunit
MKLTVRYSGLARAAAGKASEEIDLPAPADLRTLLAELSRRHGAAIQPLLATGEHGAPAVLAFVGDQQVTWQSPVALKEGDEIMLLSPISGG